MNEKRQPGWNGGAWSTRVWWPAGLEPSKVTIHERAAALKQGSWKTGDGRTLTREGKLTRER